MTAVALTATAGRSPYGTLRPGTDGRGTRPATGQAAMATKPVAAKSTCGGEPPCPACSGLAATPMVAAPTAIRITRPASAADLSASPVMT
jgi:hypothetical protein